MLLGGRCHSSGNTVTFYLRNGYSQCTQFLYRVHELAITFYPAADNEDPWYAVAIPGGIRLLDRMGKPIEGRLAKFYDLKKN